MKTYLALLLVSAFTFASSCSFAHPGSGIVVDAHGTVFVSDINRSRLEWYLAVPEEV